LCLHHVDIVPESENGVKYTPKNYKCWGINGDNKWMFPGSQDYHILRKIIIESLFVENYTNEQTIFVLLELVGP